jgi:N-methylhydantoinase B
LRYPFSSTKVRVPMKSVLGAHPIGTIRSGGAFVTNDPEASGRHLGNVTI